MSKLFKPLYVAPEGSGKVLTNRTRVLIYEEDIKKEVDKMKRKSVSSRQLCRKASCQRFALPHRHDGLCSYHVSLKERELSKEGQQRALVRDRRTLARNLTPEEFELADKDLQFQHIAQRFYRSSDWQKLSKFKRRQQPLCEHCEEIGIVRPAAVADHIVELQDDWSLRLDINNLQSLCHQCHNRKTERERRRRLSDD